MKNVFLSVMVIFSVHALIITAEIPEPYCSIHDLPFDDHGWFGSNAVPLENFLNKKPAKVVIEVGSWLGKSTRFIGQTIPEDGKVYAVDTWLGNLDEPDHQNDPRLSYLYQLFLSNTKQAGLSKKIIPVRMKSLEASKALNVIADLIYIDATHDEENVYQDIMAWYSHLAPDGIICGDDWMWQTVKKGVFRAGRDLGRKVRGDGNCWWFE